MRHYILLLALAVVSTVSRAQTLHLVQGSVTYEYAASSTGDMTYSDNGASLTIGGKTFATSEIDQITIDNAEAAEDNSVSIAYNGSSASVIIAGNIAPYVSATVSGAHVSISQGDGIGDDTGKVEYTLTGTSTDGEFYLKGSYKMDMVLNGVTLTNPSGPAIYINNGKKINVTVKKGTENTLADGTGGDWKGAFRVKGHTELKGKGTLNISGNSVNGFWGKEYLEITGSCTLNIKKAVKDGINVNQYFSMEDGTVSISDVGDDGIQVSYKTDDDDNVISLSEDEDNTGALTVSGGTLTVSTTAAGSKGLKAEGTVTISETSSTTVTITVSGGTDTSDSSDLKASACIKGDTGIKITGGTVTVTNSGQGGRAINTDGTLDISGGTIVAAAKGSNYGSSSGNKGGWPGQSSSSSNHKYAKGVKADGAITISGGDINITSVNHEGLESKSTLTISGGTVYVKAYDDAINSSSDMTISGGTVTAYSTNNDGLDSNGNMYIKGGTIVAMGASGAETGIDIDEQHRLYISGGNIFGIGGRYDSSLGSTSQGIICTTGSVSANTAVTVSSGSTTLASFTMPASYSSGTILISCQGMTSGSSYTLKLGSTSTTATAGSSISSSGMGGGGNQGGPGRR